MQRRHLSSPNSVEFHQNADMRPAKRHKWNGNANSDGHSSSGESDIVSVIENPRLHRLETHDSEKDGEYEDMHVLEDQKLTELENALLPVRADREAIAEYESMRATSGDISTNLKERLDSGQWAKGKSSIYVDAFNLALHTVLEDEGHLFDEAEKAIFSQWKSLDYEAQYLYVRLFLRKTSKWHRISCLGYEGDVGDMAAAVARLLIHRSIPELSAEPLMHSGGLVPANLHILGQTFTFADDSAAMISTLDEASSLLSLEELKSVARDAKIQGKNKSELLKALSRMSERQSGLEWVGLKIFKSNQSEDGKEIGLENNKSELKGSLKHQSGENDRPGGFSKHGNRDDHFLRKILASIGPCIRLAIPVLELFERVHLVFYRSTEWTEKSLTTIILARMSRRIFPQFIVSRSTNIFTSRSALLEFEAALRSQFRVDSILEFNGPPGERGYKEVLAISESVYPHWRTLLDTEQRKEDRVYDSGEGAYLRRFSPAWVYTRIIHKACYVYGRFKMHEREWHILTELLNQRLFHVSRRGAWFQRKALLEEHYLASLRPIPSIGGEDQQKRHWKRIALQTCEHGLQDRDCHVIYHYDLQKRVRKLERNLKVAKREQHDFGHFLLRKPVEICVAGIRIQKEVLLSKNDDRRKSTKTVWIDEREGGGECSVESMCLSWYRDQGWRGYHAEGGIIRTLFAYLFYDILFIYIPNVFQTPYQTCPLDLHTDAFYASRASEINQRLVEIANGDAERLIRVVDTKERSNRTCVAGLDWDFVLDDLLEIATCFDGAALSTICKVMAQEYQQRGGGIPDLFLWDPKTKEVMFSEVKSENDRLSDTQRLWIHVLIGAGVRVELCNALAREVRTWTE